MKVDSHSHSKFSPDGHAEIAEMAAKAKELGAGYLAITDHCDKDALQPGNEVPVPWRQLDIDAYYSDYKMVKAGERELYLAFGIEAGYDHRAEKLYREIIDKYPFDVVINSVHFVEGWDVYFPYFFEGKTKDVAYRMYFEKVYESLFADYPYDIVGHIGYCVRNAPYPDPVIHYEDYSDLLEPILRTIIRLGKTLEVNTHHDMCPNIEILKKYYEFGGRKISFGSDAHRGDVLKDYDKVSKTLKEIGFTHYTYFKQHIEEYEPIE
ncbi:MAG: histidinol-phosphatase HisJ family protein [Clostridiales bacterium]|nr:histidinol-phosphatase HisJ family protein [Clostridiales bacterium]